MSPALPSLRRTLPRDFIEWQVKVRALTMDERHGSPHVGVAPLVLARSRTTRAGVTAHSVICGLLPSRERLEEKTKEFRALYESASPDGARALYDKGIEYLKGYYRSADDFDPASVTTLLDAKSPLVAALRADARCALVFHVFDLTDRSEVGRLRCWQIDCEADVLSSGPVYDNVWWHNTLFHGTAEGHVVVHFRGDTLWDTRFGALEPVLT